MLEFLFLFLMLWLVLAAGAVVLALPLAILLRLAKAHRQRHTAQLLRRLSLEDGGLRWVVQKEDKGGSAIQVVLSDRRSGRVHAEVTRGEDGLYLVTVALTPLGKFMLLEQALREGTRAVRGGSAPALAVVKSSVGEKEV